ncbi:MCE family protein [Mycobacterium sp. Y57]|uniref:MCE family protein n=1 Tax=Mycolicibacterium xanthum TaxID=2796469 RepID=UPI001C844C4E|nr:MCE family protein [Mycolicibacterium xanthum]MBX7434980.1 MCE family protein [Mycolicibacterium xanthum]
MTRVKVIRRAVIAGACVAVSVSGCGFQGVNSLPLPGAVGRGPDADAYTVKIANVATLEPNSPVMIDDVVVGSIRSLRAEDWHAVVEISVKPDVAVPANAVASVGQTSLLGSMHMSLDPPAGEAPEGRLAPGATIELDRSSTYPTTEQTLAALAAVVNGGGLGQIGDVIHNASTALDGRAGEVRELLTRLDDFVGTLDAQRDAIVSSIKSLNRLASTFAEQRDDITRALDRIPPAIDVLVNERPRLTTALQKLGTFSDTATRFVSDSKDDLVRNLQNLEPAIKAFADVGPDLDAILEYAVHFPFTQSFIDRAIRGDYYNLYAIMDLTVPRLKRSVFLGTRWEQEGAEIIPAPGDPNYLQYTYDPLKLGIDPPPPNVAPPLGDVTYPPGVPAPSEALAAGHEPVPPVSPDVGPILPVRPPAPMSFPGQPVQVQSAAPEPGAPAPIFAGPYDAPPAPGGGG